MSDPIIDQLRRCCLQVIGHRPGSGFLISPSILVTCAHVVGNVARNSLVAVKRWTADGAQLEMPSVVIGLFPNDDLAILHASYESNCFAPIMREARHEDQVVGVGFPKRGNREEFDQFTAIYEGHTQFLNSSGRAGFEDKFKAGQVERGFSGGPLLNLRTCRVMGIIGATRDRGSDLGGWAINIEHLEAALNSLNISLPPLNDDWRRAQDAQRRQSEATTLTPGTAPRSATRRPFQAPSLPRHYVERSTALSQVLRRLTAQGSHVNNAIAITAVHGLGGIGKSSLAAAVANSSEARSQFPDGVLWATLGQEPQLLPLLLSWIQAVGDQEAAQWSVQSASNYLRTALYDRALLLIIDDAWDEEEARPFLIGGSRCRVLMTTRLAHVADSVGADAYSLQEMTEQESLELITKRMQKANEPVSLSSADRSEALTLIAEVGSHPLALELVGALVSRHYNWSETRHQLLIEQSSVEPSSDYVGRPWQKIEACLSLSLRYLQREDPIAWKSILWLSLLPPKQEINEKMAAHIWRTSYVNAERILGTLYDDALITKVDNGFTIHDLMHGMTRRVFPRPIPDGLGLQCEEGHATIVDNYFQLVGGRWDQLPDDGYAHSRLVWHLRACRRFDAIRSLLKEEDSNGQSMWYAKRVELGQTSGYLEDIRIVQSSEHRSDGDEISDAFLWALIVSSIKSVSSNIHPDVFTAIVARGLWSPARAFQWIVEVGRDDLCSEYFVSFVSGVDMLGSRPNVEIRQAQRLRAKSLLMGRQLLLSAPATKSSIRIMVKLIILLDHNDKLDAARQAYIWCKGANDKLEFLANLPTDLKRDFVGTVADMVLTSRDSSEKVQQIAKLIPILHETRRYSALTALFDVMERLIQAENDSEGTPEEHSLSSQSGTEGFKVSLGWPTSEARTATRGTDQDGDGEDFDDENWIGLTLNYETVTAIRGAIFFIPNQLDERALRLFKALKNENASKEFISGLREVQRLRALPQLGDADPLECFTTAVANGNIALGVSLIPRLGRDPTQALIELFTNVNSYNIEESIASCSSILISWPSEKRLRFAREMRMRFPRAASVSAMLLRDGGIRDSSPASIASEIRKLRDSKKDRAGVKNCIMFGPLEVGAKVLEDELRIEDTAEQAKAMFALMPYLPRTFPREILDQVSNPNVVGSQIAGLAEIIKELILALSAGVLTEVVESASQLHSEWWVVEALTSTLVRIRERGEFAAVLRASRGIRNLDLRARIVSRVAVRAADFGYVRFAIDAALTIELPPLRWEALGELAIRFASIGDTDSADAAASEIVPGEDRSRAYMGIALEVAAQSKLSRARLIVASRVESQQVQEVALRLLGNYNDTCDQEISGLHERRAFRQQAEGEVGKYAQISGGLANLAAVLGHNPMFEALRTAADCSNADEVNIAAKNFWAADFGAGRTFSEWLGRQKRPALLKAISQFAPLIGTVGTGGEIVGTVRAIRNVCRWWP